MRDARSSEEVGAPHHGEAVRTERHPSLGVLFGLLVACCGLFLMLAPGVAAAYPSDSGPRTSVSAGARIPPSSATGYVTPAAGHDARSALANRGPAEDSSSEQDRRYVIGAVGVGLILLVLLVRRKRGKSSIVLRWRKRS